MYMACNAYLLEDVVVYIWDTDCLRFVFWVACVTLVKVKKVILFNFRADISIYPILVTIVFPGYR